MSWWITFTVVLLLLFTVGFNPIGAGAGMTHFQYHHALLLLRRISNPSTIGTLAAAFQSFAYGGLTPAGGIFATLTSMGMLGVMMPLEVGLAVVTATATMMIVWACGVGR